MYTRCPECGTVYRITIRELRAAEGHVRCSTCAATFSALLTLSDDPPPGVELSPDGPPLRRRAREERGDGPRDEGRPAESLPAGASVAAGTREAPDAPEASEAAEATDASAWADAEERPEVVPEDPPEPPAGAVPLEYGSAPPAPAGDELEFDVPESHWSNFFGASAASVPPAMDADGEAEESWVGVEDLTDSPEAGSEAGQFIDDEDDGADAGDLADADDVDDDVDDYEEAGAEAGHFTDEEEAGTDTGVFAGDDVAGPDTVDFPDDKEPDWAELLGELGDDDADEPVFVIADDEPPAERPGKAVAEGGEHAARKRDDGQGGRPPLPVRGENEAGLYTIPHDWPSDAGAPESGFAQDGTGMGAAGLSPHQPEDEPVHRPDDDLRDEMAGDEPAGTPERDAEPEAETAAEPASGPEATTDDRHETAGPLDDEYAPEPRPAPDIGVPGVMATGSATGAWARESPTEHPMAWQSDVMADEDYDRPRWRMPALALLVLVVAGLWYAHGARDRLAADERFGPAIEMLYGALDQPLYPAWDLRAYEVRASEAVVGRSAPAALDVSARVAIVGAAPVGAPHMRVTLRDRRAEVIGRGIFGPEEYLPTGTPALEEPLRPGIVLPVQISIDDPGAEANGYEVDVCIPDRTHEFRCQRDSDPFRR